MLDFKVFGYIISISWIYPADKWFGYDSFSFYKAIGLGFATICIYLDD
jgi:hypothetical protein